MVSAGNTALASDVNYPATVDAGDSAVTNGTTTSTAFTNSLTTTGIRGIAFTAGASGAVMVWVSAVGSNSNAGQATLLDIEVRTGTTVGSGAVARAPNEATAGAAQSDSAGQNLDLFAFAHVTGLTPGSSYNACLAYRVTANTGTYNRRNIAVLYVP